MAIVARYLIHTSAAARMNHEQVAQRVAPLISAGLVGTCPPLDFEALFSARNPQDYEQIRADRQSAYEYLPVLDEQWQRAMGVQRSLAEVSRHRSVGLADLLVAAVAEQHRLTVLHYDSDYDTISELTGVQALWVVAPGVLRTRPTPPIWSWNPDASTCGP